MSVADLLKLLTFLRKRAYFWDGLVVLLVLVLVISWGLCRFAGPSVAGIFAHCGLPFSEGAKDALILIMYLLAILLSLRFWYRIRTLHTFRESELGVVFAPHYPEGLQEDAERLFVNLKQHVKGSDIGKQFAIVWLPPNINIYSSHEAIDLLHSCRGTTAVWGPFEQQQNASTRSTGFARLSFTFVHAGGPLHPLRQEVLALSMIGTNLRVRETDQIADRNILARNIGFVVRNILGITLLTHGNYSEAAKIFGPLSVDLAINVKQGPLWAKRVYFQSKYDLAYALTMSAQTQFLLYLFQGKLFSIPREQLNAWLANTTQAQSLDPQNSIHPLSRAIYLFLLGDISKAIKASLFAKEIAPLALAAPNLSLAFLYNFVGDYKKSRNEYFRGLSKKTSYDEFTIRHCITFSEQTVTHFPNKLQLRLALGLLKLRRGDPNVGRQEIRRFVEEAHRIGIDDDFVREGYRLLQENQGVEPKDEQLSSEAAPGVSPDEVSF